MVYAKLKDQELQLAPRKLPDEETVVYNPPLSVLNRHGYKPVRFSEHEAAPAGQYYAELWTDTGSEIVQSWELRTLSDDAELAPDEALAILLGGVPV